MEFHNKPQLNSDDMKCSWAEKVPKDKLKILLNRFWNKVNKLGPIADGMKTRCWIWTASTYGRGYGQFRGFVEYGSSPSAHKIIYELINGDTKNGKIIMHSCDNPSCVRPDHLVAGTYKQNMQDMDNKNRRVVREADDNTNSILTSRIVRRILKLYRTGKYTHKQLSRKYHVTETSIWQIFNGISWKSVTGIER